MEQFSLTINSRMLAGFYSASASQSGRGSKKNRLRERALKLITAGRAGELMRASVREQLRKAQEQIGFSHIRFHGLFHEELFICRRNDAGELHFTWHYLDELIDFLVSIKLRPFLELGFMPDALKSGEESCFWWKGNITPPGSMGEWEQLIRELVLHLVRRYGKEEVRSWYFEVWNEPNLGGIFWTGGMEGYFRLFESTWRTIKKVDEAIRVGGPSTSNFTESGEAPWFSEFDDYCRDRSLVPDFFSCHPYPNSWAVDKQGDQLQLYRDRGSLRADCRWLDGFLARSVNPEGEIHLTEWNSSPSPRDLVHDTAFMGPFILDNLADLPDSITSVGYWALSDCFEENGIPRDLFHGGFGLVGLKGWKKPSWYAYQFLAKLKGTILEQGEWYILAGKGRDQLTLLAWNYTHYNQTFASGDRSALSHRDPYGIFETGKERLIRIEAAEEQDLLLEYHKVGPHSGSPLDEWIRMGAPEETSRIQEAGLEAAITPQCSLHRLSAGSGTACFVLKPHEMVLIHLSFSPSSSGGPESSS